MVNKLNIEMIKYYSGDGRRIQHFTKVYSFAKLIGEMEKIDEKTQYILEISALTHDIGIKIAEEKFGSCSGKLQEQEGPLQAYKLLNNLGFEEEVVARVCYLIGHHHTYKNIDGVDYQILIEADFLVNLQEENSSLENIQSVLSKIFKTKSGIEICKTMFNI